MSAADAGCRAMVPFARARAPKKPKLSYFLATVPTIVPPNSATATTVLTCPSGRRVVAGYYETDRLIAVDFFSALPPNGWEFGFVDLGRPGRRVRGSSARRASSSDVRGCGLQVTRPAAALLVPVGVGVDPSDLVAAEGGEVGVGRGHLLAGVPLGAREGEQGEDAFVADGDHVVDNQVKERPGSSMNVVQNSTIPWRPRYRGSMPGKSCAVWNSKSGVACSRIQTRSRRFHASSASR